jgi:hypothetical protein
VIAIRRPIQNPTDRPAQLRSATWRALPLAAVFLLAAPACSNPHTGGPDQGDGGGGGVRDGIFFAPDRPHPQDSGLPDGSSTPDVPVPPDVPPTDGPAPDEVTVLDFSCVGHNTPPAPTSATVTRAVAVLDPTNRMGIPGVNIDILDSSGQSIGVSGTTGADGVLMLDVPVGNSGFTGSIHVTANGYVETYASTDQPITQQGANILFLVTPSQESLVGQLANVMVNDSNSAAIVLATDCAGNAITGAEISVDAAGAVVVYVDSMVMPHQGATGTFSNGVALIGQLPAGPVTVTMKAPTSAGAQPTTIGTLSFTARNGTLAEGVIQPD